MDLPGVRSPIDTDKTGDSPAIATSKPAKPAPKAGGKLALLTLSDLDGRTQAAKQAAALREAIFEDLGGEDQLSAIKRSLVDSVAISTAIIQDAQVRWLKGEAVNLAEITTLSNARRRDAQLIGLDRVQRDITDLDAYLAKGATT